MHQSIVYPEIEAHEGKNFVSFIAISLMHSRATVDSRWMKARGGCLLGE